MSSIRKSVKGSAKAKKKNHSTAPVTRRRKETPSLLSSQPPLPPRRSLLSDEKNAHGIVAPTAQARIRQGVSRAAGAVVTASRAAFEAVTKAAATGRLPPLTSTVLGLAKRSLFSSFEPTALGESSDIGVAISDMSRRYSHFAGTDRGFRIKQCQPLCHLGVLQTSADLVNQPQGVFCPTLSFTGTSTSSSYNLNTMAMHPYRGSGYAQTNYGSSINFSSGVWFPDSVALADMAMAYSRYRVVGNATFHFEPVSSTAVDCRIEMAFTEDPAQPRIGMSDVGNLAPGSQVISSTPYSVAFSPWMAWSMTVPADNGWKYLWTPGKFAVTQANVNCDVAQTRDACWGAISSVATRTSGSATVFAAGSIFGRLVLEVEYEFSDPVPLNTLVANLTHYRILAQDDIEGEFEGKVSLARKAFPGPPDPEPPVSRAADELGHLLPVPLTRASLYDPPPLSSPSFPSRAPPSPATPSAATLARRS